VEKVVGEVVFSDYPDGKFARKIDWWITPEGMDLIKRWRCQGLSVQQICDKMEVDIRTLRAWRKKYPELETILAEGKEVTISRVEQSLYNRAVGYDYEEITRELIEGEMRTTKVVKKHVPADVKAMLNFLYNRDPQHWRAIQEPLEQTQYTDAVKNVLIAMKEVAESGRNKEIEVVESSTSF